MTLNPEVREATAAPPAVTPAEHVQRAIDRLALGIRLADAARSVGIILPGGTA